MLELDASHFGPLTDFGPADLTRWASLGRTQPSFAAMLHAAMRGQFFRSAVGASFGQDVGAGLAREEASAILELAAHQPIDALQREAKWLALRPLASSDPADLLGAIVRTALAHDARSVPRPRTPVAARRGRRARVAPASR